MLIMARTQSLVHRQRLRTSQDFSTVLLIDITKAWFHLWHRLISGRSSVEDRGDTHNSRVGVLKNYIGQECNPQGPDQFRFLGNYPPTPSLSHHFALSEK